MNRCILLSMFAYVLAGCSSEVSVSPKIHARSYLVDPCPLEISVSPDIFRSAIEVALEYSPPALMKVDILLPIELGIVARRLGRNDRPMTSGEEELVETARFKEYGLTENFPTSAWKATREQVQDQVFSTPPGSYQIVFRYIVDRVPGKPRVLCRAASPVFEIQERSFWITNAEGGAGM